MIKKRNVKIEIPILMSDGRVTVVKINAELRGEASNGTAIEMILKPKINVEEEGAIEL